MDADRRRRVDRLFEQALDLPESERALFLEKECATDDEVRAEVASLLRHHEEAFLETPDHLRDADHARTDLEHPVQIGPYKILSELGKGGMGVVYLAEQAAPVRRRVALKLVKLGMDTKQVVARFETERQALAIMDHPNVARVFDAGETETGRPYFVMEYVKGVSITDHCDRNRLDAVERLRLFIQVCEGIQHAHQKGIIHRDIKASNVLVTIHGNRAVPKIIDFGVAKATDQRLAEQTVFTEFGQLIGTPEYMSPEQADVTGQDIDTRSDVYSLGVLFYELLVGAYPFDLRRTGYEQMRRVIREVEPPRPSTRFGSLGDRSTDVSNKRRTNPHSLLRELKGDLDWIALKALEKNRTRRYSSASEFASDVKRHLRSEPVLAGPPGNLYRMQKFVRRHRAAVIATAVVLVALSLGVIGTSVGWAHAAAAEQKARADRSRALRLGSMLSSVLTNAAPSSPAQSASSRSEFSSSLLAAIDEAHGQLIAEPIENAADQSGFLKQIGETYRSLLEYDKAEASLEQALRVARAAHGDRHESVASALVSLGNLYRKQRRPDRALGPYQEAVEIYRGLGRRDDTDLATCLKNLGDVAFASGEYEEALQLHRQSLEIREKALGPDDAYVARSLRSLSQVLTKLARHDEASIALQRALEIRQKVLGPDHPDIANVHYDLAAFAEEAGDLARARRHLDEAVAIYRRAYRCRQPEELGMAAYELGWVAQELGDLDAAFTAFGVSASAYASYFGEPHEYTADSVVEQVAIAERLGRSCAADELKRQLTDLRQQLPAR